MKRNLANILKEIFITLKQNLNLKMATRSKKPRADPQSPNKELASMLLGYIKFLFKLTQVNFNIFVI